MQCLVLDVLYHVPMSFCCIKCDCLSISDQSIDFDISYGHCYATETRWHRQCHWAGVFSL